MFMWSIIYLLWITGVVIVNRPQIITPSIMVLTLLTMVGKRSRRSGTIWHFLSIFMENMGVTSI